MLSNDITSGRFISWLQEVFAHFRNPDTIMTDNGTQFASSEFATFLQEQDIKHEQTVVYNPQQNGIVECFNRYLKYGIQTFQAAHKPFKTGVTKLLFNYCSTSLTPNMPSPAELLFNQCIRTNCQPTARPVAVEIYHPQQPRLHVQQQAMCRHFQLHDMVRVQRPQVLKGHTPFSAPLKIVQVLSNYMYKLSDSQIWNARKLVCYTPPEQDTIQPINVPQSLQHPWQSTHTSCRWPPTCYGHTYSF